MMKVAGCLMLAAITFGCSSIESIEGPSPTAGSADGLTYFMPKKDFVITMTVNKEKVETVTIGTTEAYPDLSTQYLLRYKENPVGKNTLNVTVTESGLLTSSKSTTVSNVADAFKNLAATFGGLGATRTFGQEEAPKADHPCKANGTYTFVYDNTPKEHSACGMKIQICPREKNAKLVPHSKAKNVSYSGVFYRQNLPYLVTVTGDGPNVAAIVFSPSGSATHFMPVSRTLFSNNEAEFAFADGVPTKYKQDTEGEVIALLKLPAEILGAYFGAIGSIFDSFKTADNKQAAALAESLKLELAKKKYDACISAIKVGDDKLAKQLGCE